jgi:hypothetical protein
MANVKIQIPEKLSRTHEITKARHERSIRKNHFTFDIWILFDIWALSFGFKITLSIVLLKFRIFVIGFFLLYSEFCLLFFLRVNTWR